jgi:hypothetical protein
MRYIKLYENFEDIQDYFIWLMDEISVQFLEIDKYTIDIYIQSYDSNKLILDNIRDYLYDSFNRIKNKYYINNIDFQVEYRRINLFNSTINSKSLEDILESIDWVKLKPSDYNTNIFNRPIQEIVIRVKKR